MVLYIRMLNGKRKWDKPTKKEHSWLPAGLLPADAITHFKTDYNRLSFYTISEEAQAERIVAAMAAKREKIETFDYAVIEEKSIAVLNIKQEKKNDEGTCDPEVDTWHINFLELDSNKIIELARIIIYDAKKERVLPLKVKELILQQRAKGNILDNCIRVKLD